ncbi:MAG TPA: cytochrome c biogenesis protein CcdC [Terracidiphilus sp.]
MMVLPPITGLFARAAGSIFAAAAGFVVITIWRVRESRSAVSLKKIIIPPLGMSTGFSMFVVPAFRVPLEWAGLAFLAGAMVLAWPLLLTTRLERRDGAVMMKRSSAFLAVILVLAAVRFAARGYFDTFLSVQQTGGLFFILAFGMIVVWRGKMLMDYRKLTTEMAADPA